MVAHRTVQSTIQNAIHPSVHPSADVHEFSLLEGDVTIGANAVIAPGTAVTAEPGAAAVAIGAQCVLLPGVIVEGIAGAQIVEGGKSGQGRRYSVWVGDRTIIAHKSILHSPAFIDQDCFIGFRSTIFNARLGKGCVVMMHALVQDVEIPPGKCVPSGSIITSQHQADQLPQVRPEDLEFAREIVGTSVNNTLGSRTPSAQGAARSKPRLVPVNSSASSFSTVHRSTSDATNSAPPYLNRHSSQATSQATEGANMQATQTQRLSPETVQQVRQYLSQGYRIGMEHADVRRYRSGVWETCTPIKDTREQAVFEALERCLAEHSGEYVRIFGIDPKVKSRVGMVTVQRPGSPAASTNSPATGGANFSSSSSQSYGASNNGGNSGNGANGRSAGTLSPEVVQEVRNLLRSGHIIGTEHADTRHYRSNVWKSCSPIASNNDQEVFSRLEHCLDEHGDEFVRMFGIDPKAKRRTAYTTIQRADGKPVNVSPSRPAAVSDAPQGSYQGRHQGSYASASSSQNSPQNSEAAQVVGQILSQGGKIGVEIADVRRYRSGIWQTAPSLQSVSQLQNFLSQNADKYVRVFSVNASMKTRGATTTIQKPGQSGAGQAAPSGSQSGNQSNAYTAAGRDPINANPPHYDDPAYLNTGVGYSNSGNGAMDSKVMDQVTQLVNQGCRISVEFADRRRFRSGIWQTGPAIDARRPAEAIAALSKQLAQHQGDYVRLVGVDPQAKRRVVETTIQRP
jgi:carbon dioxide concentrating mechanism protein CcmM